MVTEVSYYQWEEKTKEMIQELLRLKRFEEQIRDQQPFKVNERVQLSADVSMIDYNVAHGWAHVEKMLQPGNTGTITGLSWNSRSNNSKGAWQVSWMPDVDWSLSEWTTTRHVYIHHKSRRHIYYMPYRWIAKVSQKKYTPILPPSMSNCEYHLVDIPKEINSSTRRDLSYQEVVNMFSAPKGALV